LFKGYKGLSLNLDLIPPRRVKINLNRWDDDTVTNVRFPLLARLFISTLLAWPCLVETG